LFYSPSYYVYYKHLQLVGCERVGLDDNFRQGGHEPGKTWNTQEEFSEPEKLWEFCATSGKNYYKLECGPMPNLMAALPNIGGALSSTPQSLADAHY